MKITELQVGKSYIGKAATLTPLERKKGVIPNIRIIEQADITPINRDTSLVVLQVNDNGYAYRQTVTANGMAQWADHEVEAPDMKAKERISLAAGKLVDIIRSDNHPLHSQPTLTKRQMTMLDEACRHWLELRGCLPVHQVV